MLILLFINLPSLRLLKCYVLVILEKLINKSYFIFPMVSLTLNMTTNCVLETTNCRNSFDLEAHKIGIHLIPGTWCMHRGRHGGGVSIETGSGWSLDLKVEGWWGQISPSSSLMGTWVHDHLYLLIILHFICPQLYECYPQHRLCLPWDEIRVPSAR